MALDGDDFELLKSVRRAIREGDAAVVSALEQIAARDKTAIELQQKMLEAFNRLADRMENLTQEVREMRRELTPPIDKPKTLLRASGPGAAKGG